MKLLPDFGFSFDLQLLPELMTKTADVLATAPDTQVALCHAGSPYDRTQTGLDQWARALKSLADQSQVSCKLSGLGMFDHDWTPDGVQPIVQTCLREFGAERCMFGSNFPVDMITSTYQSLMDIYRDVDDDTKNHVLGTCADRFYAIT